MGGKKIWEDDDDADGSLVGRRVQKHFQGFGKFAGNVTAYNASHRFYKVVYDDGDREELESHEVQQILVDPMESVSKRGRHVENGKAILRPPADTSLKKKGDEGGRRGPGGRCEIHGKSDDLELCKELGHRSRGRQSTQCARNDALKDGPTRLDGCKEEKLQIYGDVQRSCRQNAKRKEKSFKNLADGIGSAILHSDEDSRLTKAKNSKGCGRRPSRMPRCEKLLQSSDDDESDADADESSDFEVGGSDSDSLSSERLDVEDSAVVHAPPPQLYVM